MLHRFSKRCRPFNQNGTERNDKNYGKKTTVSRAFYRTEFGTFFWRLLYVHNIIFYIICISLDANLGAFDSKMVNTNFHKGAGPFSGTHT